mmetsp:Transcript_28913/g.44966  ORF Transcript_28913/g.44966 Transcript_28913/m.44966 type:complete len:271 (+) Transcript_28913:189-1001(+)|eukprot:CAMPEP_0196802924 /NCGR_PEP_ID=MMETSP1362-20130617/2432_1 /TAXON_ID=163516 /ORGANISM="Leptocylindrus danicus, Strain CCMP1856" /LENGTH=270 /DNA_ID=CAMNT_0042174341 /DNA_START=159 /DNA_END=971 /DNA_ORIENTATION=-
MSTKSARNAKTASSKGSTLRNDTFPTKLHEILDNPEFSDIICWLPHGKTWKVLDAKAFEKKIMPQYFVMTKWSSFARQVNGWGFYRILVAGPDRDSYHNQLFMRDHPELCKLMRRRTRPKFEPIPSKQVSDDESSSCMQPYVDMQSPVTAPANAASFRMNKSQSDSSKGFWANIGTVVGSATNDSQIHSHYHRVMNSSNCCFTPIPVPTNEESLFFETIVSDWSDMDTDDANPSVSRTCRNGNEIFDFQKRKRFPFGQYPKKVRSNDAQV